MRWWLILLTALLSTTANAVTVWKWVDKNGVPHYTDYKMPGATQIELTGLPSISTPPSRFESETETADKTKAPAASPYKLLAITAPTEQQTLWNIGSTLTVQLQLSPRLRAGDSIDILLDGKRQHLDKQSLKFTMPKVYRGVHTLQAIVINSDDKNVMQSKAITFMVQQTSLLNPNNHTRPAVRHRAGAGAPP